VTLAGEADKKRIRIHPALQAAGNSSLKSMQFIVNQSKKEGALCQYLVYDMKMSFTKVWDNENIIGGGTQICTKK
jgi:hypothetical protein